MEDKKGGGWRLQEGRWWCLIRSFVLLPLLWWALGFDSAAPVSSGIPLLPWQSHTYSHSSGILLNLCPANSQKMLAQAHMHHQRQTWIFDSKHAIMLSYTYWIPSLKHIYIYIYRCIYSHTACAHIIVCHVWAWRAVSLKPLLTWMQICATTICQLTALYVHPVCNLDTCKAIWHKTASYLTHGMPNCISQSKQHYPGIEPWASAFGFMTALW